MKKFLFWALVIVVGIVIISVGVGYYIVQKNNERCPIGYIFTGFGCSSIEAWQEERDLIEQRKAEGTYDQMVEVHAKQANDGLKIRNIQTIVFDLSRYKGQYGSFPKELSELNAFIATQCSNKPECISTFTFDPKYQGYSLWHGSNNSSQSYFYYAVRLDSNGKAIEYHLGTSLDTDGYLDQDHDFHSTLPGWLGEFGGEDSGPCRPNDGGNGCYDVGGS